MPGQKISSLPLVTNLLAADEFPLSRSASTYKITGDKFASKAQLDSLSATVDVKFISLSSTVDRDFIKKPASASAQQVLTFNSSTSTWVASAAAPLLSAVDSPTIDFSYNSTTGILSANATISVVDSPTIDLSYNSATGTLSASVSSINSFFTGTNQSLTINGYQKLPGGLIIQWGTTLTTSGEGAKTITFPISFPTSCLNVSVTTNAAGADSNANYMYQLDSANSSQFIAYLQAMAASGGPSIATIVFIAIGY